MALIGEGDLVTMGVLTPGTARARRWPTARNS